jgi:hypothetical protein
MIEKFKRSWSLVKASWGVLQQDKEMLVFPLLSMLAMLAVVASFVVPFIATGAYERFREDYQPENNQLVYLFLFYLVMYFIIFFFNTALVGAAMIRLEGGDPTVMDGLRVAGSRVGSILGYAVIAATVGVILRIIEERLGWIGKIITGLIGAVFTVATFLVVPVLVVRNVGPIEAVKESAQLLKQTWGENVIGNAGMGVVFFLVHMAIFILAGCLFWISIMAQSGALALVVLALTVIAFITAALYRYATNEKQVGGGFDAALLGDAFKFRKG